MTRKAAFLALREGAQAGPYDEVPVVLAGIDPQIHISRNDRRQPFFLTCEKDVVLAQMSGEGRLHLQKSHLHYVPMKTGDHVYIPAGTPHCYEPASESIQMRYKAEQAGLERVHWSCPNCAQTLHAVQWDTAEELPQEGYMRACRAFNENSAFRTCAACGAVHDEIDLAPYRWAEVAADIRAQT